MALSMKIPCASHRGRGGGGGQSGGAREVVGSRSMALLGAIVQEGL